MSETYTSKTLPENLQDILRQLLEQYEKEDSWIRKQQIKSWKHKHEFWHGIQYIFWSETNQDWMVPTDARWLSDSEGREGSEGPFYDYVINIYRANGESIIAALSSQVPAVRFPPDDADNDEDQIASQVYGKIADLIQRHNPTKKILMDALFLAWNDGIWFTYCASKSDKAFGTLYIPHYEDGVACDDCGYEGVLESPEHPTDDICPQCAQQGNPAIMQRRPVMTGHDEAPKSRVLFENYGALFVKVPYYAKNQDSCGYLMCTIDQPKALLKHVYPDVADKIDASESDLGQYERLGRAPSSFSVFSQINEDRDLRPLKRVWFRPWIFAGLGEEQIEERKALETLFPSGCSCTFIGKTFVEARDECMDSHWTIGQAGLSQYIHPDALGQPLIPIQEMRNTLANLTLETIEHGIPSSYADPAVLDFAAFSRQEARPGMVNPAKAVPGKSLGESFYEGSRSTLGKEVPMFAERLDTDGQFVTGAFPSIYGGPGEGSGTLGEYQQSRAMAIQRLSICWSLVLKWWAELMERAVNLYVENLQQDEKYTVSKNGHYESVFISLMAAKGGKVGEVEPESSETFPVTIAQKQAILLQLLQMGNDFINEAIMDPENRKQVAQVLAFNDIYIPGENQRIKQSRETQEMLKYQRPIPIDPDVDDHEIHIECLVNSMVDVGGLEIKRTQPQVYAAWLEHLMMHKQAAAQAAPPPEPPKVNVNLGVQGKDLGDPAVKDALVKANIIDPNVQVEAVIPPAPKNGVKTNVSSA